MDDKTYTCFLDEKPAWSCKDLGTLIAHVQRSMDDLIMGAVGDGSIFKGRARHAGKSYTIEIRKTDHPEDSEGGE